MSKALGLAMVWILASAGAAVAQVPKTDDEKTIYALGVLLGQNVSVFALSKSELEIVKKGVTDAVTGAKLAVNVDEYRPKIDALARSRSERKAESEKAKAKPFLDKAAAEKGATKTSSGLIYTILKEGTGEMPASMDTVKVHYRGTLTDGTEFDSSYKRGQPTEFPLNGVIPCWTEGVQKIKVGGKAKLVCPSSIAYGDRGQGGKIPGGATLVFEVELLGVTKGGTPPPGGK
jgi:FKBP-type peptidyl-prolyl cis-trans isomerase FkpA